MLWLAEAESECRGSVGEPCHCGNGTLADALTVLSMNSTDIKYKILRKEDINTDELLCL